MFIEDQIFQVVNVINTPLLLSYFFASMFLVYCQTDSTFCGASQKLLSYLKVDLENFPE